MKFIVCARPFNHKSFGVVALHRLNDTLNKIGHVSRLLLFSGDGKSTSWYLSENHELSVECQRSFVTDCLNSGVVVYPEIIHGNPLGAKNVARYLLNFEGKLKGWPMLASARDVILVHSKAFRETFDAEAFLPPSIPEEHMQNLPSFAHRTVSVTYIGKGVKLGYQDPLPNTVELTRTWPETKPELFQLLRNTRFYYSFDYNSATNLDPVFAGAVPKVFIPPEEKDLIHLNEIRYPFFEVLSSFSEFDRNAFEQSVCYDQYLEARSKVIDEIQLLSAAYVEKVAYFADVCTDRFEPRTKV